MESEKRERRGAIDGRTDHERRRIEYCNGCRTSSTFELFEYNGGQVLICIGEQRGPVRRPSCGMMMPYTPGRLYGDCLKCRQVRRAFKAPDGNAYCTYCLDAVVNVSEFKG